MKEYTLGIAERLLLIGIFNNVKSDIVTLKAVLNDIKDIAVTEEEKKEVNFRIEKINEVDRFVWDRDIEKTVTMSPESVKYTVDFIKQKSEQKELSLADVALLSLSDKLTA